MKPTCFLGAIFIHSSLVQAHCLQSWYYSGCYRNYADYYDRLVHSWNSRQWHHQDPLSYRFSTLAPVNLKNIDSSEESSEDINTFEFSTLPTMIHQPKETIKDKYVKNGF